jgi:hypothetical protein
MACELPILQARQRYEDDAAALRALRMCLREVTLRLLADRRWKSFREPGGPGGEMKMTVGCVSFVAALGRHFGADAAVHMRFNPVKFKWSNTLWWQMPRISSSCNHHAACEPHLCLNLEVVPPPLLLLIICMPMIMTACLQLMMTSTGRE